MKELSTALRLFVVMSILTGIVYPLLVTGLAQSLFNRQANGSLITIHGQVAGSDLVGQQFDDPSYFWSRPSATSPFAYNAAASSGSNLGPTNPSLVGGKDGEGQPISGSIADRVSALKAADPAHSGSVPTDLATASGSGLDPHISIAAAEYQIARVAKARGIDEAQVQSLVQRATTPRQIGILGEPVVNVLLLNLSLNQLSK